jgi:5-methylcytosine-specific restriction endonuclease McrA
MAMTNAERDRRYYAKHKDDPAYRADHVSRSKIWAELHPERVRAYQVKYGRENREKLRLRNAEWRRANGEKVRQSNTKWRKENLERLRIYNVKRYKAKKENLERLRIYNVKRYKANIEKFKASSKTSSAKWYKTHPEADAVHSSKRRSARYANTPIDEMLTSTEWLAILAEHNGRCHYCQKVAKLTLDHVIPLSRGGKHSKDNVVPACKHCNSSKGNKTLEEWNNLTRLQLEAARG